MLDYYVYELIDPRDNSVFYVGKGKGNRVYRHAREYKYGTVTNNDKFERIGEIISSGSKVIELIVAYFFTEKDAFGYERERIGLYGKDNLTNKSSGRNSYTEEAKRAMKLLINIIGIDDFNKIKMDGFKTVVKDSLKPSDIFASGTVTVDVFEKTIVNEIIKTIRCGYIERINEPEHS